MPARAPVPEDELQQLLAELAHQRGAVWTATAGLSDSQARSVPPGGPLSVGGIVKHISRTERGWMEAARGCGSGAAGEYVGTFRMGPADTVAGLLAGYREVASDTETTVGHLGLDHPVAAPRGLPWFAAEADAWTLRWVLRHLVKETARHAGHAGRVREAVGRATPVDAA